MSKKKNRKQRSKSQHAGVFFPPLDLPPEPAVPEAPLSDAAIWADYARACLARSRSVVEMIEAHNRRRTGTAEVLTPLDFRGQHRAVGQDRKPVVERVARQMPDAEGRPGHPHRAYDTLATLFRNGSIDADELAAGRSFEEDFRLARLDPLHASNPARIRAGGVADLSDGMLAGREKIARAMTALGGYASPAGSALWIVLGGGWTLKDFARSSQLAGGRSLDEKVAKGIFVGALGVLAVHYGLKRA